MTSKEIKEFIDIIWDGVENSKAGKIYEMKDEQTVLHHIGFQTFLTVLASLCPKSEIKVETSGGVEIKEPKEKWQQ